MLARMRLPCFVVLVVRLVSHPTLALADFHCHAAVTRHRMRRIVYCGLVEARESERDATSALVL